MTRRIMCLKCAADWKLHAEDLRMAWQERRKYLSSRTPQAHGLTINGVFYPMADIECDGCAQKITGDLVVALTMWRQSEGEPRDWEPEYGTVLDDDSVELAAALSGQNLKSKET